MIDYFAQPGYTSLDAPIPGEKTIRARNNSAAWYSKELSKAIYFAEVPSLNDEELKLLRAEATFVQQQIMQNLEDLEAKHSTSEPKWRRQKAALAKTNAFIGRLRAEISARLQEIEAELQRARHEAHERFLKQQKEIALAKQLAKAERIRLNEEEQIPRQKQYIKQLRLVLIEEYGEEKTLALMRLANSRMPAEMAQKSKKASKKSVSADPFARPTQQKRL